MWAMSKLVFGIFDCSIVPSLLDMCLETVTSTMFINKPLDMPVRKINLYIYTLICNSIWESLLEDIQKLFRRYWNKRIDAGLIKASDDKQWLLFKTKYRVPSNGEANWRSLLYEDWQMLAPLKLHSPNAFLTNRFSYRNIIRGSSDCICDNLN